MKTISSFIIVGLLGALAPACDLDVPDLNNPGIGDLTENPTPSAVTAATTGLLIGNRRNTAQANGYIAQLGILGREAYNFDQADPRFIGELLQGNLNSGSPFGGNFWTGPYANIRLANTILTALDKVLEFTPEEKSSIRGFVKTIKAMDLLEVINTRDDIGAVIDTDRPIDADLAPIAEKDAVFAEIASLLDEGAADLDGGGDEFPFALSNGYTDFDTPATFKTFNRAIKARVAAYQKDYPAAITALGESFLDDTVTTQAGLDVGVYHSYSTGAGDAVNNLINPNIFVHPSIQTAAKMAGGMPDERFTRKVTISEEPGSAQGLTSDLVFTIYGGPDAPVAIIRNEELLLLRAEARFLGGTDKPGGLADLNKVRTLSGGLAAVAGSPTDAAFTTELLYDRRYSLLFEGGHSWIDARRFDVLATLPLDMPDHKLNRRYPVPLPECNARPNDAKCALTSE